VWGELSGLAERHLGLGPLLLLWQLAAGAHMGGDVTAGWHWVLQVPTVVLACAPCISAC